MNDTRAVSSSGAPSAPLQVEPAGGALSAVALDGRVRLRSVAGQTRWPVVGQNPNAVTVKGPGDRIVRVYAIGAVVVEGPEGIVPDLALELAEITGRHLDLRTEERLRVSCAPVSNAQGFEVDWDRVVLPRADGGVLDAVSHLLAQSVALERYERGADAITDETLALAGEFARQGRPPWRRGLPIRRIAALAVQRLELARWFFPLDRPEWTWEDAEVARLYDALFEHYELHDRHEALLHKLASVESTLQVVINLWEGRRSRGLEWAIVILIVLEIVLAIVEH